MYTFRQKHNKCILYKLLYILYYSSLYKIHLLCFFLYLYIYMYVYLYYDIVITQHNGDDAHQDRN
jgi:hypothetical protein